MLTPQPAALEWLAPEPTLAKSSISSPTNVQRELYEFVPPFFSNTNTERSVLGCIDVDVSGRKSESATQIKTSFCIHLPRRFGRAVQRVTDAEKSSCSTVTSTTRHALDSDASQSSEVHKSIFWVRIHPVHRRARSDSGSRCRRGGCRGKGITVDQGNTKVSFRSASIQ